jgi:lysyl endopeptidase
MKRKLAFAAFATVVMTATLFAQSADPLFVRDAIGVKSAPAAPRLAENAKIEAAMILPAAAAAEPEQLDAIRVWNAAGNRPAKNGFSRRFTDALAVHVGAAASAKEGVTQMSRGVVASSKNGVVWSGIVKAEGAYRMRLHLEHVKLPEGAVLWVYGKGQVPTAFGRELVDDKGSLWVPSVDGDTAYLEIEVPTPKSDADAAEFTIAEMLEIVAPLASTPKLKSEDDPTCLIDVTCISTGTLAIVNEYSKGVGHLEYVKDGNGYVCSGGLLNDIDTSTTVPYFLTANHCFSTQASATSLEVYWDWRFANCNSSTIPNPPNSTRTLGSTLLATSATSDFTFLKLNSIPAGRILLGWNTSAPAEGSTLYRISHPAPEQYGPLPQMFSTTVVDSGFGQCDTRPQTNYIYSTGGTGGIYGGSSGSPTINSSGQVLGQLFGTCGPDPTAGCDRRNATVDGRFTVTYNSISSFLQATSTPQPCSETTTTMCLAGGRFAVSVTYTTAGSGSGSGKAIKYTADSGLFWFFESTNIEMLVKVLNACSVNNRFWVFGAASTDVGYTITVKDSQTGSVKTYTNPIGTRAAAITDTGGFVCP